MANMGLDEAQRQSYVNIIPVSYAVTYIFGTAGSAWVLSSLGPKMLGGLEKVKAACKELETRMGTSEADEPGFEQARRPVVFRAYRIENDWFGNGKTVDQLESYFISQGKRLFVERMRHGSSIVNDIIPGQLLQKRRRSGTERKKRNSPLVRKTGLEKKSSIPNCLISLWKYSLS